MYISRLVMSWADDQTEFEWENKVALSAPSGDLRKFVDHLAKETNLQILTPENALSGDCSYLSCNMAAKSLFGEDALGNISLELDASGEIRGESIFELQVGIIVDLSGHLRIRSRTQGIALSLGDKITLSQKAFKP
jgi:coatomer subunit beta